MLFLGFVHLVTINLAYHISGLLSRYNQLSRCLATNVIKSQATLISPPGSDDGWESGWPGGLHCKVRNLLPIIYCCIEVDRLCERAFIYVMALLASSNGIIGIYLSASSGSWRRPFLPLRALPLLFFLPRPSASLPPPFLPSSKWVNCILFIQTHLQNISSPPGAKLPCGALLQKFLQQATLGASANRGTGGSPSKEAKLK